MMKRQHKAKSRLKRDIAMDRINTLFREAGAQFKNDPMLSDRYVELARKIAMKYKLKMPSRYRRQYCNHCYSYLRPGANCRVRATGKTISYFCLNCRKFTRIGYK